MDYVSPVPQNEEFVCFIVYAEGWIPRNDSDEPFTTASDVIIQNALVREDLKLIPLPLSDDDLMRHGFTPREYRKLTIWTVSLSRGGKSLDCTESGAFVADTKESSFWVKKG